MLVEVQLRPGIADPQGATIERALPLLGFEAVSGVTVGKAIRFTIEADDAAAARCRGRRPVQALSDQPGHRGGGRVGGASGMTGHSVAGPCGCRRRSMTAPLG